MADIAMVAAVVFAVNLLPAFGPPTWAVLVFLQLNLDVAAVPLVLVGALSAASGRLILAHGARRVRRRLSTRRLEDLEALRARATRHRAGAVVGLGLFAISPVPSAQLFLAAGITGVPLLGLTGAFFTGRLVSYSLYVGAASAAEESLGPLLTDAVRSPVAIAVQIALLAAVVALARVPWARLLADDRDRRGEASEDGGGGEGTSPGARGDR